MPQLPPVNQLRVGILKSRHNGLGIFAAQSVVAVNEGEHTAVGLQSPRTPCCRRPLLLAADNLYLEVGRRYLLSPFYGHSLRGISGAVVNDYHLHRAPLLLSHTVETMLQQVSTVMHRYYHAQLFHTAKIINILRAVNNAFAHAAKLCYFCMI